MAFLVKYLKRMLFFILLCAPFALFISWSLEPAVRTSSALMTFPDDHLNIHVDGRFEDIRSIQRKIQRHFSRFQIYVPIEDIVFIKEFDSKYVISELMEKACGKSNLYVWVPFAFKVPFWGKYVYELCWKPNLKLTDDTSS